MANSDQVAHSLFIGAASGSIQRIKPDRRRWQPVLHDEKFIFIAALILITWSQDSGPDKP